MTRGIDVFQVKSLSLADRFKFAMSPCNTRNQNAMGSMKVCSFSSRSLLPSTYT